MPWFKVDDGWWSHPKILTLSDPAQALWVRAGSWSMKHLTDGVIPKKALPLLRARPKVTAELVDAGLWTESADAFRFHDWMRYQPSRAKIEQDREAAAERQRKSRGMSRRDSHDPNPTQPNHPPTEGRPSPFCGKHPTGTDAPCVACGRARVVFKEWETAQKNKPTPGPPTKRELCPEHPDLGYRRTQCPMH